MVIGKIKLTSLFKIISCNSNSLSVHSMSQSKVCSDGKKFLIKFSLTLSSSIFRYSWKKFGLIGSGTLEKDNNSTN